MSFFEDTFVEGLVLSSDNGTEMRLTAPAGLAASYTLTLPAAGPSVAGDNLLSVTSAGVVSMLNISDHTINSGKILKTLDGATYTWSASSVAPQLVGLSGPRASFSSNAQYVLTGAQGAFVLSCTTAFNPAALPTLAALDSGGSVSGAQPSSITVATTVIANDSLSFSWTPGASVARLSLGAFVDQAGAAGSGLVLHVTPVAPTTLLRAEMEHDTAQNVAHATFTAGAPNAIFLRFSRALDPTYAAPTITAAAPAGGAVFSRYGGGVGRGGDGRVIDAVWTPASVVTGTASLTVSSVRDVLGFVVANAALTGISTVAPLTLSSVQMQSTLTTTRRTYAVLGETHSIVAAFSRNVATILLHAATSLPSDSTFATLAAFSVVPAAATVTHASALVAGATAGVVAQTLVVVDEANNLPYAFSPSAEIKARLAVAGFTTTVNLRGHAYTAANAGSAVHAAFSRAIASASSAASANGTAAFTGVSGGNAVVDYTTPAAPGVGDELTFSGVRDDAASADSEPALVLTVAASSLLTAPVFASWVLSPSSAAATYSAGNGGRARARFSTALSAVSAVTASSGAAPTGASLASGPDGVTDVEFDWNTATSTSPVTLTFVGLISEAGQPDIAPTESVAVTLVSAPTFASWTAQAFLPSTVYSTAAGTGQLRAVFSKTLAAPPVGAAALSVVPSAGTVGAVAVDGSGALLFDFTSPASLSGLSFTFQNLFCTDGARAATITAPAGPAVTSFTTTVGPGAGSKALIAPGTASHTFVFTKAIASVSSMTVNGGGSVSNVALASANTVTADISATALSTAVAFSATAVDTSQSTGIAVAVTPVAAAAFVRLEYTSNPTVAIESTALSALSTYNLIARFSKNIDGAAPLPSVVSSAGSHPSVTGYYGSDALEISWTPSVTGGATLTFSNVRDADGFVVSIGPTTSYSIQPTPPPTVVGGAVSARRTVTAPAVFDGGARGPVGYAVPVRVRFSKPLISAPTPIVSGGGTAGTASLVTSVFADDTVLFLATAAEGTTQIAFASVTATDFTNATSVVVAFAADAAVGTIVRTEIAAAPGVAIGATAIPAGVATRLRLVFPPPSGSALGVGLVSAGSFSVSGTAGGSVTAPIAIENASDISFNYTPASAGNAVITVGYRIDNRGFEYPSVSSAMITIA